MRWFNGWRPFKDLYFYILYPLFALIFFPVIKTMVVDGFYMLNSDVFGVVAAHEQADHQERYGKYLPQIVDGKT